MQCIYTYIMLFHCCDLYAVAFCLLFISTLTYIFTCLSVCDCHKQFVIVLSLTDSLQRSSQHSGDIDSALSVNQSVLLTYCNSYVYIIMIYSLS